MRIGNKVAIAVVVYLLTIPIVSSQTIEDLERVSAKIQALAPFIQDRTVAIKIVIGDQTGFGSGAIISSDGMILTCAHVAEVSDTLTVILSDGRQYQATKLGMNGVNDYALLKIEGGEAMPYLELGNSGEVQLLEWVIAVGHPGGPYPDNRPSMAVGRVRGLHKRLPVQFGIKFYDDAIQTDAPIFSGNSGGPLLDLQGRVIGINGAITLVNDLAFAVPIDEIKKDLPQMAKGNDVEGRQPGNIFEMLEIFQELQEDMPPEDLFKVFKGTPLGKILELLGEDMSAITSTPDLGIQLRQTDGGPEIDEIKSNSIAQMAGLKNGDRIVSVNGEKFQNCARLQNFLDGMAKGEQAVFEIERDRGLKIINVTLDRQAYSRNTAFQRAFAPHGIKLVEATVKIRESGKLAGYGVIIDPAGLVLTNYQMLKKSPNLAIQLQNPSQTMYPAEVVGENAIWDVALLKFRPEKPLTAIEFGNDRDLKIGQWVISGGCESGALQVGMVSATDRYVPPHRKVPTLGLLGLLGRPNKSAVRAYPEVIQHDSSIEADQFGTPLTDENGRLIGLNCGHFYRGTTFAIPISGILEILPRLREGDRVAATEEYQTYEPEIDPISKIFQYLLEPEEKSLGEIVDEFLEQLDEQLDEQNKPAEIKGGFLGVQVRQHWQGVEVVEVLDGYAGSRAGIKNGDVITEIGKQKVHSLVSLLETLKHIPPGTKIEITVIRKTGNSSVEQRLEATLDERPE